MATSPATPTVPEAVAFARAFSDHAPQPATMVLDRGHVLRFAAGHALVSAGYDPGAMIGRPFREAFAEPVWDLLEPHVDAVLRGDGARSFSYESPTHRRVYWMRVSPVGQDAAPEGALLVGHAVAAPDDDRPVELAMTEHFTDAVTASPMALALCDMAGRVRFANPACGELVGREPEDVVGMGLDDAVHPDDRGAVRTGIWRLVDAQPTSSAYEYRLARPGGEVVHVRNHVTVVRDADGRPQYLFCQLLDITERRHAEEQLARRLRQQSAVAAFGRDALAGDRGLEELLGEAAELVAETLGADRSAVLELDDERRAFTVRTGQAPLSPGLRVELAGTLVERVLATGVPAAVADGATGDLGSSALGDLGLGSALVVPIGRPGEEFGALGAYGLTARTWHDDEQHFLLSVANVLGDAVRRHQVDLSMRRQALHDAVTGLPNRVLLEDRLRSAIEAARRTDTHVAVLFLDLDAFKVVNDSLGHHAGDDLLCAVADRLRAAVRSVDTVARFGGDEFVVVAGGLGGEADAQRLAQAVLRAVGERPVQLGAAEHVVRASVGVRVAGPGETCDTDALLRDADSAMYRAKHRGRNRIELFDDATRRRAVERLDVERDLRRALERAELELRFQPFARLADGSWFGAEALLRWQHPERGLLSPAAFLDIAEESGLIVPIGEWSIGEACRVAAGWGADAPEDALLTVNLSPRQLAEPGLVAAVREALATHGVPAHRLGLEITERALIDVEREVEGALAELHALGVRLLLDDFGTGFSSLSHLKRFPIDGIKIDRSFIAGLAEGDADDAAIVQATLAMAWGTGTFVIPEGVETPDQAEHLRRAGCRVAQGYLFGLPMREAELQHGFSAPAGRPAVAPPSAAAAGSTAARFAGTASHLLAALALQMPGAALWLGQLDTELAALRIVASAGELSLGSRPGDESPLESSLCHLLATGRAPELSGDVGAGSATVGFRSYAGKVLEVDGTAVGTLCAVARHRDAFGEDDLERLGIVARLLGDDLRATAGSGRDVHEHLRRASVFGA